MKFTPAKPHLLGQTIESLAVILKELGQPAFRAKQVIEWIYKKFETDPQQMTNLPQGLRDTLCEYFTIKPTTHVLTKGDPDTTQKLLLRLEDGHHIETVLIKAPASNKEDPNDYASANSGTVRKTLCISTQVGCAYGCKFCASGLNGWKRDLLAGEIIGQLFEIIKVEGAKVTDSELRLPFDNIVVMGMGEPLANFDNLMQALGIINAPWGFNFGARRITVSTSGLVPRIKELAELPTQFRLAISLHGATNEVRSQIMPVNRKYPLEELIEAAKYYNTKHNRMITFEYILIDDLNATKDQAEALGQLCADMNVHINAIPYNTVEGLPWQRPSEEDMEIFIRKLKSWRLSVTIRREKGHSIDAACGQLRLQHEKEKAS